MTNTGENGKDYLWDAPARQIVSVNERLSKVEEHLAGQDKILERIAAGQEKFLDKIDLHHSSLAEAHESLRWMKRIGGSILAFLSAHTAWLHAGGKH